MRAGLQGIGSVLVLMACSPPRLPPITAQNHADGTATRMVQTSRVESKVAATRRLLASLGCEDYEVVAVSFEAERVRPPSLYWIRYRCEGKDPESSGRKG
jgi:hypothetical protein